MAPNYKPLVGRLDRYKNTTDFTWNLNGTDNR